MKSQRRHELQQNSLNAELGQIARFFRKNGTKISWIALIVAAAVLGWVLLSRRAEQRRIDIQARYDNLKARSALANPESRRELIQGFTSLAGQDTVEWIAADALLELGRISATEALLSDDPQAQRRAIERAEQNYRQLLGRFSQFPAMTAAAHVGLGKIAEDRNELDEAKKHYTVAVETPGLDGYPVLEQAEASLADLDAAAGAIQLATTQPGWMDQDETVDDQEGSGKLQDSNSAEPETSP